MGELTRWTVETLSSKLHDVYQAEAHRRGDVRHADRYEDLPEETKEWDRVLARWILTNWTPTSDDLAALVRDHAALTQERDALRAVVRRLWACEHVWAHDWEVSPLDEYLSPTYFGTKESERALSGVEIDAARAALGDET